MQYPAIALTYAALTASRIAVIDLNTNAPIVRVGLAADEVGKTLLPRMKRFGQSWDLP